MAIAGVLPGVLLATQSFNLAPHVPGLASFTFNDQDGNPAIYLDRALTIPLTGLVTDNDGSLPGYAAAGVYQVIIQGMAAVQVQVDPIARLTGNPADDTKAISAGTGQPLTLSAISGNVDGGTP